MAGKIVLVAILVLTFISSGARAQETAPPWQNYMSAGQAAMIKRDFAAAEVQFAGAVKEAESFGKDDHRLILSLDGLAMAYRAQNKFSEAEAVYLRVLRLTETKFGPEHPSTGSRVVQLAEFYYSLPERRSDALSLMARAIRIYEKALGPDSPELAITLIQTGYWYGLEGKDAEAEPLLLRALSIQQKAYGPDAGALNTVLTYLAAVRIRQHRLAEAEALYRQVQDVLERAIGTRETGVATGPPSTANEGEQRQQNARSYAARLNNLTGFYTVERRFDDAEAAYKHALALLEKEFGENHFAVAMVLDSYAQFLKRMQRVSEAESMESRAKLIRELGRKN